MMNINVDVDEKELQRVLNNDVEKMGREEAERMVNLIKKISNAIDEVPDCTYQDVMRAFETMRKNYERKGRDLLNGRSIQEVSRFGALLR